MARKKENKSIHAAVLARSQIPFSTRKSKSHCGFGSGGPFPDSEAPTLGTISGKPVLVVGGKLTEKLYIEIKCAVAIVGHHAN